MYFQASEIANMLIMIIDSHWKRLSSIDFAYTVPLEPPYMNCKANYLTTNRQITNTTNINTANTLHSTSGAMMQKGNQRWLGQVCLQTGTEDSTAYAWPSWTLISKKIYEVCVQRNLGFMNKALYETAIFLPNHNLRFYTKQAIAIM